MVVQKRRVVQFIHRWVLAVRHVVFDDPAATHFIEVSLSVHFQFINFVNATECDNRKQRQHVVLDQFTYIMLQTH